MFATLFAFSAAVILLLAGASRATAQYVLDYVSEGGFDLHFIDAREGFAIGENVIWHTTDTGATWKIVTPNIAAATGTDGAFGGMFTSRSTGWIIAQKVVTSGTDSTFVYRTTNGGATWARQLASPVSATQYVSHRFTNVHFVDERNGWAFGKGIIMHTGDGGATWSTQALLPEQPNNNDWFNCAFFRSAQDGWIGGYGSFILHTTDGGAEWSTQHVDSATHDGMLVHVDYYYLYAIHFADAMNGIASTNNGNYLATHDGGHTWQPTKTGFPHDNMGACMLSKDVMFQVGGDYCDNTGCYSGESVLFSTDGGTTWKSIVSKTIGLIGARAQFRSVQFVTPRLGFVTNDRGQIFQIRDTSASVAAVDPNALDFSAPLVFPNPANDDITVESGSDAGAGQVNLYDAAGTRVYAASMGAGACTHVNSSLLPAGCYVLEVIVGSQSLHRKVVVKH